MKQRIIQILAILGIILVSGCIGSNIVDKIPTKDLPSSLEFGGKNETTIPSEARGIKKVTSFTYFHNDNQGPDITNIYVIEMYPSASADRVAEDTVKNIKQGYVVFNASFLRGNVTEENITLEETPVKHLQIKIPSTTNPNNIIGTQDSYIFVSDSAVIYVESREFLLMDDNPPQKFKYGQVGLELTNMIIQNLKK